MRKHPASLAFRSLSLLMPIAGICANVMAQTAPASAQKPTEKPTLFYIPHTHWEGAVFQTREEYLELGLPHILQALALLRKYPNYRFTLDQAAYVRPFIERYPERRAEFLKYVHEGRLALVGGMDVMPDDVKPGGELFVRQMQYGKGYFKDQLGVDVTTAWMLDTFGHHPQMPQLLRQAGFTSFWFCRGVAHDSGPSEFLWQGIDGTTIPAFWLPGFYGLFWGPPNNEAGFSKFFTDRYHALDPHALPSERVGLAGVDVSEPEAHVPPLVDQFNLNPQREFTIKTAIPTDFESVVAKRKNRPILTGDFNPIFQGTYSSRIELKQETREIEQELLTAEKLQAINATQGSVAHTDLMQAWEPVLFNQTHDLASGVMTDHVYLDVQRAYDFSRQFAAKETKREANSLITRINTSGQGAPVVVFNPSGWARTEPVEVNIGFSTQDAYSVAVTDAANHPLNCEVIEAQLNPNGSILRATVIFIAHSVPSLGYTTYRLQSVPKNPPNATTTPSAVSTNTSDAIENQYYRVVISPTTGAITQIIDKKNRWEVLSAPGNVIAEQEDKGDLWELYHGLDGAQFIAMTSKEAVPSEATAKLSTQTEGKNGKFIHTPVYSEFSVSHPLGNGSFATRIRLYDDVPRIDITTELVNNDKLVRYQALFPTSVADGNNVQEIPFGSVQRPIGVEYPAQNWTDYTSKDGSHGLTLINAGMPGNLVNSGTMMLSLLRSHTIGGYGFGGGFEPGMTSESGYELNRKLTFHYALVPHGREWRGEAVHAGFAFNQPLQIWKTDVHAGPLPSTQSEVQISSPNVTLTAYKPGPGGTIILRLYEAAGVAAHDVSVQLNGKIVSAEESNLLEKAGHPVHTTGGSLKLDFRPFEIKTIRLTLGR